MPKLVVPKDHPPINLKNFLAEHNISAGAYKSFKAHECCFVNEKLTTSNVLLNPGDMVEFTLPEEETDLEPSSGALDIIYEDEYILAVNKPSGLLVHPTVNNPLSLANIVVQHFKETHQKCGMHPVSRLDKETSGLVIFAKNSLIHHMLTDTIYEKKYLGITEGVPQEPKGVISAPIARKQGSIIEREVNFLEGKSALTRYEVLCTGENSALVSFILETGRTHQIRVHAAYLGCPLVGDNLYGTPGPPSRHMLHCSELTLKLPFSDKIKKIKTPLPKDMILCIEGHKMCYNK